MARDIADAILSHISNFAVGFLRRKESGGFEVLGSGVLVSIEGRRGILTAGHVADAYVKLPEVGLTRFVAGDRQRRILKLGDTQTIILASSDSFEDGKDVLDLAFTQLPPDDASSIAAQGLFLNIEKNREKMESWASTRAKHIDSMLGLVAEFSQQPFVEDSRFTSPVRGVLHSGHIRAQENSLLTFEAMTYNRNALPSPLEA
jgi:hypothetical protein